MVASRIRTPRIIAKLLRVNPLRPWIPSFDTLAIGALVLEVVGSAVLILQVSGPGAGLMMSPASASVAPLEQPASPQFRNLLFKAERIVRLVASEDKLGESLACLALNIYFEARGEPAIGKLAVGHVVMNRVAASSYPATVCGVVRQGGGINRYRCQFSWWCDGKSDQPSDTVAWEESLLLARQILSGGSADPTAGALWYHADYVSPHWKDTLRKGPTFGRHIFYSKKGLS